MKKIRFGRVIMGAAVVGSITIIALIVNFIGVTIFGYTDLVSVGSKWYVAFGAMLVMFGIYILVVSDKNLGEEIDYYENLLDEKES